MSAYVGDGFLPCPPSSSLACIGNTLPVEVSVARWQLRVTAVPPGPEFAVVLSTFGYLCGMILAIPRALFAFARDGLLPSAMATVHPRFHTPWLAIIVQAVLSLMLALTSVWEQLVIFANVAVLFVYLGCAAAAWQLRRANISDEVTAPARIPGSALGPPLATVVIIALLTSVTAREWMWSGGAAGVGLLLYWFSQLRRKQVAPAG